MPDHPSLRRPSTAAARWRALALVGVLCLIPQLASTKLRPLVPGMLDNLAAIDRIGMALALEDFGEVERSARGLVERADAMREIDLDTLFLDPAQDPLWDAFLAGQRSGAEKIIAAARAKDYAAAMSATEELVGNACLGCHASFRDPARLLRPSVHVMTGFLAAWRDMNRGLAMNDYGLIESRAREISTLTGVIATDEMLESAFGIGGSKARRQFRGFLREVTANADQIGDAARQEDLAAALAASGRMWQDGCLACHDKFRR